MTKQNDSELRAILADIENETIDKSQWMPKRDQVLTEVRKDRGDVNKHNGMYFCSTGFAFDELYNTPKSDPILDSSHLSAAEFFVTLHQVATRNVGYQKLRLIISELHGGDDKISGFCPQTLSGLIFRNMQRWCYARCERLCLQPLRTNDWKWIIARKHETRTAFDELAASIEKSVDILKQRLDNTNNYEGTTVSKINQPVSGN